MGNEPGEQSELVRAINGDVSRGKNHFFKICWPCKTTDVMLADFNCSCLEASLQQRNLMVMKLPSFSAQFSSWEPLTGSFSFSLGSRWFLWMFMIFIYFIWCFVSVPSIIFYLLLCSWGWAQHGGSFLFFFLNKQHFWTSSFELVQWFFCWVNPKT